ncbi:MAG: DUF6702 family protein [Reichenbachiella sp.]|uniref:DUF6702 family protein n=1 Tax=Reichenbachiella sp. TaxID=2184521 RepID=UPI0032998796
MRRKVCITILILNVLVGVDSVKAHELNFGLFELFEQDQAYFMEIRLDKANLVEAVGNNAGKSKEDWNCALSQYLNAHMSLSINEAIASFDYQAFTFLDDIIVVTAKLDVPLQEISTIKVDNTVLLETIENQTNIIKAAFHSKKRSFRLDKDRVSTIIKY